MVSISVTWMKSPVRLTKLSVVEESYSTEFASNIVSIQFS